jgi:hypothetical protein
LEPVEVQPPSPSGLPAPVAASLETISKSVAAFAILLYGCGYLITSIYYSGYGFTETSPLRPRIVAAGAWFLLFTLIPFALVTRVLRSNHYVKAKGKWWFKAPTFVFLYFGVCLLFATQARWIFDLDTYTVPAGSSQMDWKVWVPLLLIIPLSILVGLVLNWLRVPPSASAIWVAVAAVLMVWSFGRDVFVRGYFGMGAIVVWFFAVGIIAFFEMRVRSWRMVLGDWSWSTILVLGALLVFASFYYPHIKSSWGGGKPIPVTIYLTKDSVIMPGQIVNALLIDESDSGLYVVGKGDKKATFIPHNSVGLVYFSDNVSDFSLSKPK